MTRLFHAVTWLAVAAPLISSCGLGTVGIAAGAGSGGGSGSTPALEAFAVENPKVSPCLLRLDASQPVHVALFYDKGAGERPMMHLMGVAGNEVDLPSGEISLEWDFEDELGTTTFTPSVRLVAKLGTAMLSGGEIAVGMGNDPPVIESASPPDVTEVAGIIPLRLRVSDSSSDAVSIRAEYDVAGDSPDAGWRIARPGGLLPGEPTPDFAFTGLVAPPTAAGGTEIDFFWNTDVDLENLERDAVLRFTAVDPVVEGESRETSTIHVDNNAAPIVQLDSGTLILNSDERRGIPVPFRVIDEEEDLVEVIFQWRREGETFPELPGEEAALDAVLSDPELRREHRICTLYPRYAKGRVIPIDSNTVRLPELAASESWFLASKLEGKNLELMRGSSIPMPITHTWSASPLDSPIAAQPIGDGLTALVLEALGGFGRLREIELATGDVVREIAQIPGLPTAMSLERGGERAVTVASDLGFTWRLDRVELTSGVVDELYTSKPSDEPPPVRGLASIGAQALILTAGSSLIHLDYRDPLAPQLGKLLSGLSTPWGVVVDPLPPDRVYLSERDANTILAVELDSHGSLPVVVKTAAMQPGTLQSPTALALERNGSRMLIVTGGASGQQLVGLDLGAKGSNVFFPIGGPAPGDVASMATGPDGLRLLCLTDADELLVAGGIEQRRAIASHSTAAQEIAVTAPFNPAPTPSQPGRIREEAFWPSGAEGLEGRFVWDSADAGQGPVFLRAAARDDELGATAEGAAPKNVRPPLDVEPLVLGGSGTTHFPTSVAAADLDGDGDQDIVSANSSSSNLTVFFQDSPGSFQTPLTLGSGRVVAAADIDGDGDQDLISANANNLTVFLQDSPGSFAGAPLVLGGIGTTNGPVSVAAADLDGDGDLDIISANIDGNNLTIFFQDSPGSFAGAPLVLGGLPTTNRPASVAAADLDGDGDLDLVSANLFGHNLTVFLQDSLGSFAAPITLGGFGTTNHPRSVAAADLDGDGDLDLIAVANNADGTLLAFFQNSPGSFTDEPLVLAGLSIEIFPNCVAVADLDGDSDLDLVSANPDLNNLAVLLQDSPGSFASTPLVLGGLPTTNYPVSVAAVDLDGDGDQDIVSANHHGDDLTVFFQDSPGSFAASPLGIGGPGTTSSPNHAAAADLDGDGDQDIVSANYFGDNLTIFMQDSPGSFAALPLVLGGTGMTDAPVFVAAADLDGDGDQDIVSANYGSSNLTVFFQDSPGSFRKTPLTLGSSSFVAAADIDGDGDQDIISTNAGVLAVFLQDSPGSFGSPPLVIGDPGTTSPVSVAAADLDGDGDQDLVSANNSSSNLTVFLQDSSGGFAGAPLVLGGKGMTNSPVSVAAADLDSDGDLDIVSANEFGDNLTVFLQDLPGAFAASPLVLGGPGRPVSVAVADLDSDGDLDIVSANAVIASLEFQPGGFNNLMVFQQVSPGSFAAPLVLGGLQTPHSVAAADVDSDGDLDLVAADYGSDSLTVFRGGR